MTSTELHHLPRLGQVIREQLKATALSLRLPAIGVAALASVVTMLALADFLRGRGGVEFAPELSMIPAFAAALLPLAVWQSERRFGAGFFWTLPVDRTRHALAKVFAGWLLLMIAVTGFVLWLLILALITKGNITGDEVIRLLPTSTVPPPGTLDPSMLRTVRWVPQPVLWLAPFFAATGVYSFTSALALGLRYPFRWIIGLAAAVFLIAAAGQGLGSDALVLAVGNMVESLFLGTYGLDGLLSARTESLKTVVRLSDGQVVTVWRGLPVIGEWINATLLWTGIGVAGLFAAVMRHRERR
ncbi:MAG: hypothetical protein M3O61_06625 [Gemmatimonadota bacterium]|nr:hypothetical protein [Gemmatimonadota bacterium]